MGLVSGTHLEGRNVGGNELWRGLLQGAFRLCFVLVRVDGPRFNLEWVVSVLA